MVDHKKIEEAIDSYFKNTPTAKIIENLDRHSIERKKDLDRENINHKPVNNKNSIVDNLVRFEEVSPANQDVAFIAVSIGSLVAPLGLPLYEGYDDLDEMRLTFLTLPSGKTVTLMEYLHSPQPGVCISVDAAMQNIPQIVFESCQQLQISREEAIWFYPDWQDQIDRLYAEHGEIDKRQDFLRIEASISPPHEPIDCFNHALRIYTREYVPATYWATLQHNLGLAYFNRNQGDRIENLEGSIECFKQSLEIFTQDEFPEKWKIAQDDLNESQKLYKESLAQDICARQIPDRKLKGVDLSNIYMDVAARGHAPHTEYLRSAYLMGADLRQANLYSTRLHKANLNKADLREATLINTRLDYADLIDANLSDADLRDSHLIYAKLNSANFYRAKLCDAKLTLANLCDADLSCADLTRADLAHADLSRANLSSANLSHAILTFANLSDTDLTDTCVENTQFKSTEGISEAIKQDLIARGAVFDDLPGDRSESRNLVPR
jgi:uncharacterized protein YjbI with pentapeptide repeats